MISPAARPALRREQQRMRLGKTVEVELELGLQHRDALRDRDLTGQRPQQRRLPARRHPRDEDGLARLDEGGEEAGQLARHRVEPDEVAQPDVDQPVLADGDLRAADDLADRSQPGSVGQLHVQERLRGGERPLGAAVVGSDVLHLRDQVRVGVGHRRVRGTDRAVGQPQDRQLGAADVNVLHLGEVEQFLDSAQSPQHVLHGPDHGPLLRRGQVLLAADRAAPGLAVELLLDPRQQQLPLIGRCQRPAPQLRRQASDHRIVNPAGHVLVRHHVRGRAAVGPAAIWTPDLPPRTGGPAAAGWRPMIGRRSHVGIP